MTVARKSTITFFAALMMSAIPAVLVNDVRVSIGFVSIAMLGYTGSLANMLSMPADVFPKNAVASVYGLASMGSGFGGMVFTLAGLLLLYEHSLVKANDFSRLDAAFFTMNGVISIVFLGFVFTERLLR